MSVGISFRQIQAMSSRLTAPHQVSTALHDAAICTPRGPRGSAIHQLPPAGDRADSAVKPRTELAPLTGRQGKSARFPASTPRGPRESANGTPRGPRESAIPVRDLAKRRRLSPGRPPALSHLRECPFCGMREGVQLIERGGLHLVECRLCCVEGPMSLGGNAAELWNRRAEDVSRRGAEAQRRIGK